jgi:hypothetical protein
MGRAAGGRVCGSRSGIREVNGPAAGKVYPTSKTSDARGALREASSTRAGLRRAPKRVHCRVGIMPERWCDENRLDGQIVGPGFALAAMCSATASPKRVVFGRQDTASVVRTRLRSSGQAGTSAGSGVKSRARRRLSVVKLAAPSRASGRSQTALQPCWSVPTTELTFRRVTPTYIYADSPIDLSVKKHQSRDSPKRR